MSPAEIQEEIDNLQEVMGNLEIGFIAVGIVVCLMLVYRIYKEIKLESGPVFFSVLIILVCTFCLFIFVVLILWSLGLGEPLVSKVMHWLIGLHSALVRAMKNIDKLIDDVFSLAPEYAASIVTQHLSGFCFAN